MFVRSFCALLLLTVPAAAVNAAPVHVTLKAAAAVAPDADGFFTLGSVAGLTGGDPPQRTRLAAIPVGRAPLSGETRLLTRGDIALKLRQAGCDPATQAVLEGSEQADVTTAVGALLAAPSSSAPPGVSPGGAVGEKGAASSAPTPQASPALHRGDAVTIVIRTDALTITAPGIARENGGLGDTIRVHREGVMADLSVRVLDAKTVQLEI